MDVLSISSLCARNLPRSLLRAPSPTLEFHTEPASPPRTTLPPPSQNTTAPSWPAEITHNLPHHDTTIGFVVRDKAYPHPPLAHLTISPRRALTQGWFSLRSNEDLPAGELFVSLFCPTRCASKSIPEVPDFPALPLTADRAGEKRSISPEPGALFRCGRIRLAITAEGVPATACPQLKLTMSDQVVLGGEFQKPLEKPLESSLTYPPANVPQHLDHGKVSGALENVLRLGLRKGMKLQPAGKALVKSADALRKHIDDDHNTAPHHRDDSNPELCVAKLANHDLQSTDEPESLQLQYLNANEGRPEETAPKCASDAVSEGDSTHMRTFSFGKHGVRRAAFLQLDNNEVPERKRRRPVDFGSFEVALFHGIAPKDISIQIQDSSLHLPEALTVLTDQTLQLPDLTSLKCTCCKQCNTHLLTFQMSDRGDESNKIILQITAEIKIWAPIATDTIVTPRFREVMSTINVMADTFKDKFPNAENLTYLLVGGLFTKHYPTYFEKNKQFLQEMLRLPRVQTVPIHTEGSIARNAKIIRDSIIKTCRGSKSIVLIGHSKGGLDAIAVLESFPETIPFLYGIISFQAPFGGSFLVDFVARSRLAVTTISSVIELLWKGDQESLLDIAYSARAKSLNLSATQSSAGGIPNGLEAYPEPTTSSSASNTSLPMKPPQSKPENVDHNKLDVYSQVPIVAFSSFASFHVWSIRSAANAAGVASMAPAAQRIVKHTGFLCDGLVIASDARIPHADTVLLGDMMHTEPALYVQGTRYPPGQLTASALVLLFEKATRNTQTQPP